jgi:hypothetical protein
MPCAVPPFTTAPQALADTLAFALWFNRGKRTNDADDAMAAIVARRLIEHLQAAGYVVMKSDRYRGWNVPRWKDEPSYSPPPSISRVLA